MKKVNKTKAYNAQIDSLDEIFNLNTVREIQKRLNGLENGQILTDEEVDEIFMGPSGNWADPNPIFTDPHKEAKIMCARLKEQMFRDVNTDES